MKLTITFDGGPLHENRVDVSGLWELQLFFHDRSRQVLAYARTDELVYTYDPKISQDLTAIYDKAKARFADVSTTIDGWEIAEGLDNDAIV